MNIPVTGAAGLAGSVVCDARVRANHRVIAYDDLNRGHRRAVAAGIKLVVSDVADRAALDRLFETQHVDAVMHFAPLIKASESMQVPERYFRNNISNTLNLLEAMLAHGIASAWEWQRRHPNGYAEDLRAIRVLGSQTALTESRRI